MDYLKKIFQKEKNVLIKQIEDELVIISSKKDTICHFFYLDNEVSQYIWRLIDSKRTIGQIMDKVLEEFNVSSKKAEKDIADFLKELKINGLVVEF